MSGTSTFLCVAPIIQQSTVQKIVALPVTEAELITATTMDQNMMYIKRLWESINLRVEMPMILEVENKGAVDLSNNYSVGDRTRHMETRQYYLRELKEQGVMKVKWKSGTENRSDLYTKNLARKEFEKHARAYFGHDNYMEHSLIAQVISQRESVRVNVTLCCDTPGYDLYYIPYMTEKC